MAVVKRFALDGVTYDIEPTNIDAVPTEGSNNTVSSSGVKSYVDSNYVPLSATQAPVTGLTDILTPVNLLPNSDFSRDGGYAATRTFDSVNVNQFYTILPEYQLYLQNCTMTNVTVTISTGSIRVQGNATYSRTTGDYAQIIIRSSVGQRVATYTLAIFSGTCTANEYAFGPYIATTSNIIYNNPVMNPSLENPAVTIRVRNSTNNIYHGAVTIYDINENNPTGVVDATFGVGALYEGEFKNPRYCNSLDVIYSKQFILSNLANAPYFAGLITGAGRTGIWADSNFTYFSNAQSGMFEYLFDAIEFTGGSGDPAHPIHISVDMYVFGLGMWANLSAIKYNIEVHAYTAGANNIVVKAATLTQDSSYPVTKADNHSDSYTPAYTIRATPFKNVANNPSLAVYIKQTNANAVSGYYHVFHVKQMIEPDAANASTDTRKHTWYLLHGVKRMNNTNVFSTRIDYTVS